MALPRPARGDAAPVRHGAEVSEAALRPDPNVVTELLEVLLDRAERDEPCHRDQLAPALGVPPAEVELALSALEREDAVTHRHGVVALTASGQELASVAVRRHRLTERLLLDVIGLEWWKVHHEAERWEGVISDDVEQRIVDLLGDPGTCPHGNPIPGSSNRPDQSDAVRLDNAPPGPVRVVRITETLEADDEALQLLEGCGFLPGRDAEVKGAREGWVEVAGATCDETLPPHVVTHTYVTPHRLGGVPAR